jgi:hypothetical protein
VAANRRRRFPPEPRLAPQRFAEAGAPVPSCPEVSLGGPTACLEHPGVIEILIDRYDVIRLKAAIAATEKDQGEGAVVVFRESLQELAESLTPDPRLELPAYYERLLQAWAACFDAAAERLRAAAKGGPSFSPELMRSRTVARGERREREKAQKPKA